MLEIEITLSDLFDVQADAMVNPANRQASLRFGSHINERIRKEGGNEIAAQRREEGSIQLGEAVATTGGKLPFKYVIHAAILSQYDLNPLFLLRIRPRTSEAVLRDSTRNSLLLANALPIRTIAFSPMGAGIGGMPLNKCAAIMLSEMIVFSGSHSDSGIQKIIVAVRNRKTEAVFRATLEEILRR
jgi:O-acetyl-ADP-ribose deacetylase (regulator of RNase III)